MKYRIKKITRDNNEVYYTAEYKRFLFWKKVDNHGNYVEYRYAFMTTFKHFSREQALKAIDRHYDKNCGTKTIEIEYITK